MYYIHLLRRSFLLLPVLAHCLFLQGQIIQLHELDLYRKNPKSTPIASGSIVEINATLRLHLDKDSIASAVRQFANLPPIDKKKLKDLKNLLRSQVEILALLNAPTPAEPDFQGLGDLNNSLSGYYATLSDSPEMGADYNRFSTNYDKTYPPTGQRATQIEQGEIPSRELYIFSEFSKMANQLVEQTNLGLVEGNISFLLTGFKRTSKGSVAIKLSDDFDSFEGEAYTVQRWQTSLSEEDKQQLREIADLANSLNKMLEEKGSDLRKWLKWNLVAVGCLEELKKLGKKLEESITQTTQADKVKKMLQQPIHVAKSLIEQYDRHEQQIKKLDNVDLLIGFDKNLNETIDSIGSLLETMDDELLKILNELSDPVAKELEGSYQACKDKLEKDRDNLLEIVKTLKFLFKDARDLAKSAEIISEKINRLPINLIPQESFIDLTQTGERRNGDRIVVKAILERTDGDGKIRRKIIEQIIFTVQQIGLHSVVKPALVFVDPIGGGKNVDLKRTQFQFAPSYSILFKWGSRTKRNFHDFWTPSFGINFSSPDFDTDGVPEFAFAFEVPFLNDYLTTGIGYNVGADERFWYFGFRLPIGSWSLPIFNNIEVKN